MRGEIIGDTGADLTVVRLCGFIGLHIMTKPANSRLWGYEREKCAKEQWNGTSNMDHKVSWGFSP